MINSKGFSLLELLIVAAVVSVVASLAVPNFVRSQTATNEGSAINSVRVLSTGQVTYAITLGAGYYATLAELASAGIIDDALGSGLKHEYVFTVNPGGNEGFTITAMPSVHGITGDRAFYADESLVIRYTTDGTLPNSNSPPVTGGQ